MLHMERKDRELDAKAGKKSMDQDVVQSARIGQGARGI